MLIYNISSENSEGAKCSPLSYGTAYSPYVRKALTELILAQSKAHQKRNHTNLFTLQTRNKTIPSPIHTYTKSHHLFSHTRNHTSPPLPPDSLSQSRSRRYANPFFFSLVTPSPFTVIGIYLTSVCGYKFHALAISATPHLHHLQSEVHLDSRRTTAVERF